MGIVFGLGSGRCGTLSLATLLNSQSDACCFHEANPPCMSWEGAEATICSLLRDFEAIRLGGGRCLTVDRVLLQPRLTLERLRGLQDVKLIGDVASYYLPYVGFILEHHPNAKFVCLKRDRQKTIDSFAKKLEVKSVKKSTWKRQRRALRNHWISKPAKGWVRDNLWDRCFPTYELKHSAGIEDYISRYYDDYYLSADNYQKKYPEQFRVFDMHSLNFEAGQIEILKHCYPDGSHFFLPVHENVGQSDGAGPVGTAKTRAD